MNGNASTKNTWLILVLVLGIAIGWFITGRILPNDTSAEAGFARDMAAHHAQAAEMSFIVRDRTDNKPVEQLAYDIINTQLAQKGMLMGWLQQWRLPQTSNQPPLVWMGSSMNHNSMPMNAMPGMATPVQLNNLQTKQGQEAEILYLELMIAHHKAGVDMAKGIIERTKRKEVKQLAQTIVDGQQAEVAAMEQMLAERGKTQ